MHNRHSHNREPIQIHVGPLPLAPRVAFVERICTQMIDGRHAPYRPSRLITVLSDKPETEEAVFYDVDETGEWPSYPIAEVVNEQYSLVSTQLRISLASRLVIRDVALAAAGLPPFHPPQHRGPSP